MVGVDFLPKGFEDYRLLENDETVAVIEGRDNVKKLYEMLEARECRENRKPIYY